MTVDPKLQQDGREKSGSSGPLGFLGPDAQHCKFERIHEEIDYADRVAHADAAPSRC